MNKQTITGLRYSKDNWFTCVDTEVLRDTALSLEAKLVFALLCMIAGFGCRSCNPDDEEIAGLAGVSVLMVRRAYEELEVREVIIREGEIIRLIGHNAPCYREEDAL